VPTLAEGGLQGFEYQDWWGVFAPGATPREVVDKVGKDVARILVLPDVAEQLLGQGAEARPSAADEFAGFVRAKIDAARTVAASARIRMD
jgi:tripartite-type tricarboxylate transporter receptor subunit TctC